MREFSPLYSEIVAEFIFDLPKRRQRKLLHACSNLARNYFIRPDYTIRDADGREIAHILTEGFVIAYWIDSPACKVLIIEVDDVA